MFHRRWFVVALVVVIPARVDVRAVAGEKPALITKLNSDNFKEKVVEQKGVVLVTFQADFCPACKEARPDMEELASTMKARMTVTIGEVDVSASSSLAKKYSIQFVPTFVLFKEGKEVYRSHGYGEGKNGELFKLLKKHSDPAPRRPTSNAR